MTKKALITRLKSGFSFSIFLRCPASAVKLGLVSESFSLDPGDEIYYSRLQHFIKWSTAATLRLILCPLCSLASVVSLCLCCSSIFILLKWFLELVTYKLVMHCRFHLGRTSFYALSTFVFMSEI